MDKPIAVMIIPIHNSDLPSLDLSLAEMYAVDVGRFFSIFIVEKLLKSSGITYYSNRQVGIKFKILTTSNL